MTINILKAKKGSFVWLFFLFIASDAYATDYYVSSSTGSNLNIGSQALPLKNVSMWTTPPSPLAGNKLKPGDNVFFKRGDEWIGQDAQWDITSTGIAGSPITFNAYGTGLNPLFTGAKTAAAIGNGANTWTQYAAGSSIWYNVAGSVNWACKVMVEDGTKPLWRAGGITAASGNLSMMKQGTFYSDGSKLYVWTTDGARPDTHTLYIGMHPTDDVWRGLIKVGKDGGSSYITFKNLDARMSNSQGISSSGEHQEFWNCNSSYNARDGFHFIKFGVLAPGAQYNMAYNCTATNNNITGGGGGQGMTVETPYTWLYNCTSNDNGMAGIDFLDFNTSTDVHHSGAYNCTTLNNGRSNTTINNYDPGIYVDGGRDILLYNCIVGNNGMATDKVKLYPSPGISVDVEALGYSNGKRPNNINIINCVSYNNRGEGLRIGDINGGQSATLAISNVKALNSAFQRAISNANSDAATSGMGYYTRTIKFHGSTITFKNNMTHTTVSNRTTMHLDETGTENTLDSNNNILFNSGSTGVSDIYTTGGTYSLAQWQSRNHDLVSGLSDPLVSADPTTFINARIAQVPPADPNNPPTLDTFLNLLAQYSSGTVPSDTTAPSAPTSLQVVISGSQANLTWSASTDNVGVTGYQILNGNTVMGTSSSANYTASNLSAGTAYSFTVKAYDAANNFSNQSNAVSVTMPSAGPTAPTNLAASLPSTGVASLSWSASTGSVSGYNIFRNNASLATIGAITNYTDNSVSAGSTYTYTVQACDAANNLSPMSNAATISIAAQDTTPPQVPANLFASMIGGEVNLSWLPSADNVGVIGYQVYSGIALLGTSTVTNFIVSSLTPGTAYSFTVKAYDAANNYSGASDPAVITVPDTIDPSAPANLTATAASSTQVNLSWSASTDNVGVTGYQVFNGGSLTATVTSTSCAISNLSASTTYVFTVKACDAANNYSAVSNSATITMPALPTLLPPDTVTATLSNGVVTVTWSASTSASTVGYNIYRNNTYLATYATRSYADTSVVVGGTYSYTIQSYDVSDNRSVFSAAAVVTIPVPPPPTLLPPTNAIATASNGVVTLSWSASVSPSTVGYNIYRNNAYVATYATRSYTDTSVAAGSTYSYTVQSYDISDNRSVFTAPAVVTIPSIGPSTPTQLSGSVANGAVSLSWSASSNATGYNVLRNGLTLGKTGTTYFSDRSVTGGTTYVYTVQAYDAAGKTSGASNSVTISVPIPPLGIVSYSIGSVTSSTVIFNWNTNIPAAGYVKYSLKSDVLNHASYTTSSGTINSVILAGLKNNANYAYQIVATDSTGKTVLSPIDHFTTSP